MKDPKKYISKLNHSDLISMLKTAECFERASSQKSKFEGFWLNVVNLVKSQLLKKEKRDIYELKPEY